jgi:flagellar basal-body rod protein FlgB
MSLLGTDPISSLLTTYLDVQSRRSEVVAGNIANANTPGYTAKALDFTEHLQRAAREAVAGPRREAGATTFPSAPQVVEREGPAGIDGNSVNSGREMAELAESGMDYLMGIQMLQSRLRTLRAAIREGR